MTSMRTVTFLVSDSDIVTICDGSKDKEPEEMDASVTICM